MLRQLIYLACLSLLISSIITEKPFSSLNDISKVTLDEIDALFAGEDTN